MNVNRTKRSQCRVRHARFRLGLVVHGWAAFLLTALGQTPRPNAALTAALGANLTATETRRGEALRSLEAAREDLRKSPGGAEGAAGAARATELVLVREAQLEAAETANYVLRLMIAGSFTDHGRAIDYPQRDVHLHAARPLPVQVVSLADVPAKTTASPTKTNVPTETA